VRLLRRVVVLLVAALALIAAAMAQGQFQLKDGDRVVFYGDSITEQRLYTTFVETLRDRVTGGGGGPIDVRLKRDVIAYKPTVMPIMLGMNDGNYPPLGRRAVQDVFDGPRAHQRRSEESVPRHSALR